MVKYVVRLTPEEREQLLALVNTGRAAAATRLRARILLKADVSEDGRRWTDAEIADALDTRPSTVHRARHAFVEQGLARMNKAIVRGVKRGSAFTRMPSSHGAMSLSAPPLPSLY
jgi:hypothetical protein